MGDMPMTVSEARAILKMQQLWDTSGCESNFDGTEASAWLRMVEAAKRRIAQFECGPV